MQHYFYALADFIQSRLVANELFTVWLSGEQSDFVRFNHAKVRQAGNVKQAYLTLQLVQGQKHISQTITLSNSTDIDNDTLATVLKELRGALADVQDDPHLLLSETVVNTDYSPASRLPDSASMVADITRMAANTDLVGILASGDVFCGFANSFGQRNWHQTSSWNFDWSLYLREDKAVKRGGAGFEWSAATLQSSLAEAQSQLALLARSAKTIAPGQYRAYLTPTALVELIGMLNWGGVSEKSLRNKQSALEKLANGEQRFSPLFNLSNNVGAGLAPAFQSAGFIKPEQVELIRAGQLIGSLISPRTAKEYNLTSNAEDGEGAESFDMGAGVLPIANALKALDTGLYISNLWYLNYSDRAMCRVTGMTRFACFWVEQGEIVAPLNVMRFDDSLYRLLGSQLEALTQEREFLTNAGTYGGRSTDSQRIPGALLAGINLVL
ncbi:MAG TPA: metallopeptidase TldD-related protein [Dongiaceae bacterium]|nr:metallopeptidase TldD-related protein [Dongiaceae bacterium]